MFQWDFTGNLVNDALDSLLAPIQNWLNQYPVLVWLLSHPLWLLGAILVVLFLFSGLLRAIAGLTEKLWLALLRLPITIVQLIWRGSLILFRRPLSPKTAALPPAQSSDRLSEVLNRLEVLRQEQDVLMQEVKTLLAQKQNDR